MNIVKTGSRLAAGCAVLCLGLLSLPATADVSFTPRFGYYFDNGSQRQSRYNALANSAERDAYFQNQSAQLNPAVITQTVDPVKVAAFSKQASFPQYGGTVTFDWGDEGTQIALTALYGSTKVRGEYVETLEVYNYSILGTRILDSFASETAYDTDYERVDLEATFQRRLNETFSFLGGIRAELSKGERDVTTTSSGSTNAINYLATRYNELVLPLGLPPVLPVYWIPSPPLRFHQDIDFNRYSVRAGAAAYAPVGDKHLFYVNGMLQVTRQPAIKFVNVDATTGDVVSGRDAAETLAGPDISVGYMYRISDRFGFDARYRATVYFPIAGPYEFKDSRVAHGLGIGFTSWFGGR